MVRRRKKLPTNVVRAAISAAVIIVVLLVVLGLTHRHKVSYIPTTSPSSSAQTPANNSSSAQTNNVNPTPTPSTKTPQSGGSTSSSSSLLTPTGTFVSNHKPGQNGSPTTESSVCNTTTGASCYIQFTQGSTIKELAAQTTDSTGATYWNWDIGSAGLTSGSWKITAVATLGDQTKSADDSMSLEVQ